MKLVEGVWYPDEKVPEVVLAKKKAARSEKFKTRYLYTPLGFLAFGINYYLTSIVFDHFPKLHNVFAILIFVSLYFIEYGLFKLIVKIIKCFRRNP